MTWYPIGYNGQVDRSVSLQTFLRKSCHFMESTLGFQQRLKPAWTDAFCLSFYPMERNEENHICFRLPTSTLTMWRLSWRETLTVNCIIVCEKRALRNAKVIMPQTDAAKMRMFDIPFSTVSSGMLTFSIWVTKHSINASGTSKTFTTWVHWPRYQRMAVHHSWQSTSFVRVWSREGKSESLIMVF